MNLLYLLIGLITFISLLLALDAIGRKIENGVYRRGLKYVTVLPRPGVQK